MGRNAPHQNYRDREHECHGATDLPFDPAGKPGKQRRFLYLGLRGEFRLSDSHCYLYSSFPSEHGELEFGSEIPVARWYGAGGETSYQGVKS